MPVLQPRARRPRRMRIVRGRKSTKHGGASLPGRKHTTIASRTLLACRNRPASLPPSIYTFHYVSIASHFEPKQRHHTQYNPTLFATSKIWPNTHTHTNIANGTSVSQSATPATQIECACHEVPRLPGKWK